MNALSVILEAFAPVSGRSVLDIGCGPGALAKSLAAHGALVTGIDPNAAMVTAAATAVPDGHFDVGSAERLRFADASFGGAVFLNSLHHLSDVRTALREAARVVETDARIVVVEPLTEGSFFDALRPVEDETEVRRASQAVAPSRPASPEPVLIGDSTRRSASPRRAWGSRPVSITRTASEDSVKAGS